MAKPIESTPTLRGKEAIRFLREISEEQRNPSQERLRFLKDAKQMKFKVRS